MSVMTRGPNFIFLILIFSTLCVEKFGKKNDLKTYLLRTATYLKCGRDFIKREKGSEVVPE